MLISWGIFGAVSHKGSSVFHKVLLSVELLPMLIYAIFLCNASDAA